MVSASMTKRLIRQDVRHWFHTSMPTGPTTKTVPSHAAGSMLRTAVLGTNTKLRRPAGALLSRSSSCPHLRRQHPRARHGCAGSDAGVERVQRCWYTRQLLAAARIPWPWWEDPHTRIHPSRYRRADAKAPDFFVPFAPVRLVRITRAVHAKLWLSSSKLLPLISSRPTIW